MTVLSKTFRAATVALALSGAVFTAMPAQAHAFNFSFGTDNFRIGIGTGDRFPNRLCMTDRQVRRDLRNDGYDEIRFFDRRGRIVQVTAELGRRDYAIAYDKCRGRIVDRDRI